MSAGPRRLLLPLTPLYRLGLRLRERRLASGREPIRRLQFPVISIGNLSTGGSGKTPLTIALAKALTARGLTVDVLSRGYGRRGRSPARVDPAGAPDDYGDEPILIAQSAKVPVFVASQRYHAGILAETSRKSFLTGHDFSRAGEAGKEESGFSPCASSESGDQSSRGIEIDPAQAELAAAQVHLLDDGFQHRQLHRDIDILLLNRQDLQDCLLPAGNLREALRAAERAHVIAIQATDPTLQSDLRALGFRQQIWRLHRRMEIPPTAVPVLAFCGIARPQQFFAGLEQSGLTLAARVAFADHHRYTPRDLQALASKARTAGATTLLTTEKDAIRLRGFESSLPIQTVPLCTEIEDALPALDWLLDRLKPASVIR